MLDPSKIQSLVLPSHSYQIITFNPQHLHVKIPAATFKCTTSQQPSHDQFLEKSVSNAPPVRTKASTKMGHVCLFFSRSVLDHEFNCGVSSYHILPFLLDKCQKKGWEGATHARYITSDDDCFIKKHIKIQ